MKNIHEMIDAIILEKLPDYTASVRAFVADSAEWFGYDDCRHFTDDLMGGWEETSDGGNGGFDVSWAFHKNPTDEDIYHKFCDLLRDSVRIAEENAVGFDDD